MLYIILVVRDKEINKIKENEMKTNSTITINDKTYNVNLKTKTYQYCSYVTAAGVASVLRQTLKEMKKDNDQAFDTTVAKALGNENVSQQARKLKK